MHTIVCLFFEIKESQERPPEIVHGLCTIEWRAVPIGRICFCQLMVSMRDLQVEWTRRIFGVDAVADGNTAPNLADLAVEGDVGHVGWCRSAEEETVLWRGIRFLSGWGKVFFRGCDCYYWRLGNVWENCLDSFSFFFWKERTKRNLWEGGLLERKKYRRRIFGGFICISTVQGCMA